MRPIFVIDTGRGKYPYTMMKDYLYFHPGYKEPIIVPEKYETDFASIPTWILKRWLEPQKFIPATEVDHSLGDVVWFHDAEGFVTGYTKDPVAHAAIVHDWMYSVELRPRAECDKVFLHILRQRKVWSAWIMYAAVRAGGWTAWPHDPAERLEDVLLGRAAMRRFKGEYDASDTGDDQHLQAGHP
jgi:hypothetical protein